MSLVLQRTIPCVTCQHAFLFVLSFAEGRLHLRPVAPTLDWDAAHAVAGETPPFQALPAEVAAWYFVWVPIQN
jgi:hypothetical protein